MDFEDRESDLQLRIQKIDGYMQLGSRLESIVKDSMEIKQIHIAVEMLDNFKEIYNATIVLIKEKEQTERDTQQRRENFAKKYSYLYGSEEKARINFDTPVENPRKEAYSALGRAIKYRCVSWALWPFSKERSQAWLSTSNKALRTCKLYFGLVQERKSLKEVQIRKNKRVHEYEFTEANAAEAFRKANFDESSIKALLDKPEIIGYAVLENIKEKYLPYL